MEGGDLCMSNIDERIVRMSFDNAAFLKGVSSTMSSLQALNKALQLQGASQGLNEVNGAFGKFSTSSAQGEVSALSAKFSALQVAAITALANIVSRAVDAGIQVAKSFTIEPITAGFENYETQIKAVQTILANTASAGTTLQQVNDVLAQLNTYANQTVYNFGQMTANIGTFTAAGVGLQDSVASIKGLANLAALSGSSAEQASSAMYQLSQAIAAGKVNLQDWNSVVNAGIGGKTFQDALVNTARAAGVSIDAIIKKAGSFRASLEQGWLTSKILVETLSQFTGDLNDQQLRSMGFSEAQAQQILKTGQIAVDAATKIKTLSQLTQALKEEVATAWAGVFKTLFGDIGEATDLFSGVHTVLENAFTAPVNSLNDLLIEWKELGGRQAVIDGIVNAFQALEGILTPIKDAFKEVFPPATAQQLVDMSKSFRDFMANLKIGADTADKLRRTFAGLFSILGIGWDLVKAGVKFIGDLIGQLTAGSGGFLNFTARIGDFLVSLRQAIQQGDVFGKIFGGLEKILAVPIALFKALGTILHDFFKDAENGTGAVGTSVSKLATSLNPLQKIGQEISDVWHNIEDVFQAVANKISVLTSEFIQWAHGVGTAIAGVFKGGLDFHAITAAIGTGLFATLVLSLRTFIKNIGNYLKEGGGLFKNISEAVEGLTGALKGMQNSLNAAALLGIALAVGVLTLSLIGLSKIDAAGLVRGTAALATLFVQLGAAFKVFDKITSLSSAAKIAVMAAGLILLGAAVGVFVISVSALSKIPLDSLIKGLVGLGVILGELVAVSKLMDSAAPGMIRSGAAMILLAAAVRILVTSVQALGGMNWEELAKGLTGVAVLLVSLALFTKFADADKGGISQGAGIILLATGIKILASAVSDFSKFNWADMAKGLTGVAVGLGVITVAMNLLPEGSVFKAAGVLIVASALQIIASGVKEMSKLQWDQIARGMTVLVGALAAITIALSLLPPDSLLNAAAILVVAASLEIVQNALAKMANMTWEQIAKGLITLAGSLIIIAAALIVMDGTLPGSAALLVAAAALAVLVPVFMALGAMSWSDIIAGLVALAGMFVILGAAGLLLTPVVPAIIGLGLAVTLLGIGMAAAGVGVLAFSTGISILATVGAAGIAVAIAAIIALAGTIPYLATQLALGLVAFALTIAQAAPGMIQAMTAVMDAMLDAINNVIPKIVDTIFALMDKLLQVLADHIPSMVDSGSKIMVGFLNGIANHLRDMIDAGTNVIIAFIQGIGDNANRVAQAASDTAIKFINTLADTIRNAGPQMGAAGANLAEAIIEGVLGGLGSFSARIGAKLLSAAQSAWQSVLDFFGIKSPSRKAKWMAQQLMLGAESGLDTYGHVFADAALAVGKDAVDSLSKPLSTINDLLGSNLVDFQPTIAPVLDLSQVKKDAASLTDILAMPELTVSTTASNAQNANTGFENNRTSGDGTGNSAPSSGSTFNFTQNNTSPKALSTTEIYRQTKNLVSLTKEGS